MLGQSMASLIVAGRAANNSVARRFQIKQKRLQNSHTNFFIQTKQGMKTMARVMTKTTAQSITATQMAIRSVASTSTWMTNWAWYGDSRQGVAATPLKSRVRAISTTANSASRQQYPHVKNTFVVETDQGRTFRLIDTSKFPPVKPGMVRKRLANQKTYVGTSKNIRHSPWRMNLVCQMIAGLPVPEALKQLEFSDKTKAPPVVQAVLQKTVNRADIRDGLQPTQLEVAECFATRGTPLKRIKPMARGRHGKVTRPHAHVRLVVREIDFPLRIYQQRSKYQKLKWLNLQLEAEEDAAVAKVKRDELASYKARQQEIKEKEEAESASKKK